MPTYFSGSDEFEIIFPRKKSTNFTLLGNEPLGHFQDLILDWDIALWSEVRSGEDKAWFVKGVNTNNVTAQIYPQSRTLSANSSSKCVLCGNILYVLENSTLYSVNLVNFCEKVCNTFSSDKNPSEALTLEKVNFGQISEPRIVDISSSGGKYCVAIDEDGGIYQVPKLIYRSERHRWTSVCSGFAFNAVLSDTGAVYSWGNGGRGELGQRCVKLDCDLPQRIDFFDDLPCVVTSVVCGGWHSLALTSDGDVYSWGWNESGQLGHSDDTLSAVTSDPYPVDLGSADDPIISISAGARHSLSVLKSGKVYTWGCNSFGQLAQGDTHNKPIPSEASIGGDMRSITKAVCGRWSTVLQLL